MVNAGRILIIAQGEWSNLKSYEQLDMVTRGDIAYLARKASVGVDPATDIAMAYWQPFGSAAKIATTATPGLVMPDGTTITVNSTGLIKANVGIEDITDVDITNLADGSVLRYDLTTQKWKNVTLGGAAYKESTNAVTQDSAALVESGAVHSSLSAKVNTSDIANNLTTTEGGKVLDAREGKALSDIITNNHKVSRLLVGTSGWSADTTSQSGTTLYKKTISLNHVYVTNPSVSVSNSNNKNLPTRGEQRDFNLIQYVTADSEVPCLYVYASEIPILGCWINVEGVD